VKHKEQPHPTANSFKIDSHSLNQTSQAAKHNQAVTELSTSDVRLNSSAYLGTNSISQYSEHADQSFPNGIGHVWKLEASAAIRSDSQTFHHSFFAYDVYSEGSILCGPIAVPPLWATTCTKCSDCPAVDGTMEKRRVVRCRTLEDQYEEPPSIFRCR
jgi:hypothetical protein